jgi:hypothetical protein
MDRDFRYLRVLILKFFLTSTDLSSTSSPGNSGGISIVSVLLKRDNVAANTHIACPIYHGLDGFSSTSSSSSTSVFISECPLDVKGRVQKTQPIISVQLLTWSINMADNSDNLVPLFRNSLLRTPPSKHPPRPRFLFQV